jgi:dTDP-4-dehydrorhamnose 3,5-epimerase
MRFIATALPGCHEIALEPRGDERGFFARHFCTREVAMAGIDARIVQINNSLSAAAGTLRGLHWQLPPHAETKIVRCIRGAVCDVAVDLRPDSPSFGAHHLAELTADNRRMLVVPPGCAHGVLALTDDAEVFYSASAAYTPEAERGVRFDDPRLAIRWPIAVLEVSDKDRRWPDFDPASADLQALRGLL